MKKAALIFCLVLFLTGTSLVAQPPGGAHRGPGGPGGDHPLFRIAHALDLSEEQREEWRAVVAAQRESLRPLFEEMEIIQMKLDELLEIDDPDPADVGLLVIDLRQLRGDVADSRELLEAQLADLLTAEQLAKWDELGEEGQPRGLGGPGGHGPRRHHGRPA